MTRIAITGGPLTGKTTLANQMAPSWEVIHGDDFIPLGWSQSSEALARVMRGTSDSWVVEGVQVPRALRKLLEAHPGEKPCDRLIVLGAPHKDQTDGQRRMALGIDTVLADVLPRLRALGVEIEKR